MFVQSGFSETTKSNDLDFVWKIMEVIDAFLKNRKIKEFLIGNWIDALLQWKR